ncbi:MAG TPA: RNase adapter RapZ [bacterium]|nr:RNase adapter RapZ [bacterium]HPR88391.1 RNase adapter RapZ [bacterium]
MNKRLTITIYSFGYHVSGIPRDPSGHGGGFVFDCRGLPNPGRDPGFLRLTGEDAAVQRHLDSDPDTGRFLDHAEALIKISAASYSARGFERLMVSFGCTGGQHRSVFCASRIAARLRAAGYQVELIHLDKPDFA